MSLHSVFLVHVFFIYVFHLDAPHSYDIFYTHCPFTLSLNLISVLLTSSSRLWNFSFHVSPALPSSPHVVYMLLCFPGVGVAMVLVTVYVNLYYNILVAYILYYFFASMASEVPWANCENAWNTFRCVPISMYANKSYLHSYMHGKSSPHRRHRLSATR